MQVDSGQFVKVDSPVKPMSGQMMVSDDKKSQTSPAPKDPVSKKEDAPKTKGASDVAPSKVEGGEKADVTSSSYSRGEGQKAVTQAYKDNWNAIFAKKKKR